jgi:hypothetical protein
LDFVCVGEYGEGKGRPHFHVVVFGLPGCLRGTPQFHDCPCEVHALVREAWGYGGVSVRGLNQGSNGEQVSADSSARYVARYLSGYLVKGMNFRGRSLEGRRPQLLHFSRMSGPLGCRRVWLEVEAWNRSSGFVAKQADVAIFEKSGRRRLMTRGQKVLMRKMVEKGYPDENGEVQYGTPAGVLIGASCFQRAIIDEAKAKAVDGGEKVVARDALMAVTANGRRRSAMWRELKGRRRVFREVE